MEVPEEEAQGAMGAVAASSAGLGVREAWVGERQDIVGSVQSVMWFVCR